MAHLNRIADGANESLLAYFLRKLGKEFETQFSRRVAFRLLRGENFPN